MSHLMLESLARSIGRTAHPELLFTDWQSLLGFKIGWLQPTLAKRLSGDYQIDLNSSEIIMMQATGLTECHQHTIGVTTFMVLGPEQGFSEPKGGTYLGDFDPLSAEQDLQLNRHRTGEIFTVPAGKIHAFAADPGGSLTLIGIVQPKIRTGDEFDVVPFKYLDPSNPTRVRLAA